PMAPGTAESPEAPAESPRLYFDLATAGMIPDCMDAPPPSVGRSRGLNDDLFDHGPAFGREDGKLRFRFDTSPRQHAAPGWVLVPWMLLLLVGLFGLEWLSRKLLRLA